MPKGYPNTIENIRSRLILSENGCLIWPMAKRDGYGIVSYRNRRYRVHKLLYEQEFGLVPVGMEVHHKCDNRSCANLAHLKAITEKEHVHLSNTAGKVNADKTHCPKGHKYNEANTRTYRGQRLCRVCRREWQKLWRLNRLSS